MQQTIRGDGRASIIVGWMLIAMGVAEIIVFVILALVLDLPWMFGFTAISVLLFAGGALNLWIGGRARLEITPEEVIWCGFVRAPRSLAWRDVRVILMPTPGSRKRLVAVAQLRDGRFVEIDAIWLSPTSPLNMLSTPDLGPARRALIDGHRSFLARGGMAPGWPR